jgi:hypothetical protein
VEARDSYRVGAASVLANVRVGASQLGDVRMFLNKTLIASGPAPLLAREVGAGADLVGKLLIVEAFVTDVSGQTNALSVTLHLSGGPAPKDVPLEEEASEPNGSIQFRIFILFRLAS